MALVTHRYQLSKLEGVQCCLLIFSQYPPFWEATDIDRGDKSHIEQQSTGTWQSVLSAVGFICVWIVFTEYPIKYLKNWEQSTGRVCWSAVGWFFSQYPRSNWQGGRGVRIVNWQSGLSAVGSHVNTTWLASHARLTEMVMVVVLGRRWWWWLASHGV